MAQPVTAHLCWDHPDVEHDLLATRGPLVPVMATPHQAPGERTSTNLLLWKKPECRLALTVQTGDSTLDDKGTCSGSRSKLVAEPAL